jgi:hypothetical protein
VTQSQAAARCDVLDGRPRLDRRGAAAADESLTP